MVAGGFNFQKWVTNDLVLQEYFNKNENIENNFTERGDDTLFTKSQFSSAIINFKRGQGLEWDTESDLFVFQLDGLIKLAISLKSIKRNTSKLNASFYGPLGFIGTVTAKLKLDSNNRVNIKFIGMVV